MRAALATPLRDVRTAVEVDDIRRPTPDIAVVSCTKTVHAAPADGGEPVAEGALTYVLVRVGDDWLIALAQTTPVAGPLSGAGAASPPGTG